MGKQRERSTYSPFLIFRTTFESSAGRRSAGCGGVYGAGVRLVRSISDVSASALKSSSSSVTDDVSLSDSVF